MEMKNAPMRLIITGLVLGSVSFMWGASPSEIEITASSDGAIQSSGVLGKTVLTTDESIQTSRSGGSNVRRGIYNFDLSPILDVGQISEVSLELTLASVISNTGSTSALSFYGYSGDATIEEADFDQAGTLMREIVFNTNDPSQPIGTVLDIQFDDFSPLVDAWATDDQILTVRSETVNFVTFRAHSTESTTGGVVVPTLMVSIPEPSTVLLFTLGVMGCLFIRRRVIG